MKPSAANSRSQSSGGFSLSEVAMSVGVVSAVLLPVLGLLAAGARLSNDSQDQAAASQIATSLSGGLRRGETTESDPVLIFEDGAETSLSSSGAQKIYAAYSGTGEFVRTIEQGEFTAGLPGDPGVLYLASVSLAPVTPEAGSVQRDSPLLNLTIEVESPANAMSSDRSVSRFISRIGAP